MNDLNKRIILFVMHELSYGGAQRVVLNLANNMDRTKYQIHLCLFNNMGNMNDQLNKDIVIHNLNSSRVLSGLFSFSKLIIKLNPFVVFSSITHINLAISILIPFFKAIFIKSIFVTREVNNPLARAKFKNKSKKIDIFYKRTISNFDIIVAQSNFMKINLQKAYNLDEKKIFVFNNPLDLGDIKFKSNLKLNEEFIKPKKINIISVGGLRYQKGFDLLLDIVVISEDHFHYHIIGSGPEKEKLEKLITDLKVEEKVTLHGAKSNPYQFINKADLFVITSRYEGFPNVILEANACGKFVVAFKSPGVDHEIINDGVNGVLVDFNDNITFVNKIKKYSKLDVNKDSIYSDLQKYESQKIANKYSKLFEEFKN